MNDKEYLAWLATTSAPAEAAKEEAAPKEKAEWVQAAESAAGEEVRGSGVVDDAPYPTSFADIVELIIAGKPIPGIKEIPDVVLEAPAETEETKVAARKKPWET